LILSIAGHEPEYSILFPFLSIVSTVCITSRESGNLPSFFA